MEAEGNSSSSSSTAANKKLMNMNNEDRISGLHEPLIHHILSFMNMKEVLQTSLLSKIWTNLWRSVQTCKFHEDSWTNRRNRLNFKLKKNQLTKFKLFVGTVLFLRDGFDIDKFDMYFLSTEYDDSRLIDRWVTYAKKRRVQVLRLGGVSILPLKIVCLSGRVKTLELLGISLPSNSHGDLVLDLPIVESFVIDYCDHIAIRRVAISGPKLKYLQLENIFQGINYKTSIKISAVPPLASLKCIGYTYEDYTLESLSALVTVEIDTYVYYGDKDVDDVATLNISVSRCLSSILKGITNAKSLNLSGHGFQAFEELSNMLEGVPVSVQSLKYLKLTKWCDKSYIYSLILKDSSIQQNPRTSSEQCDLTATDPGLVSTYTSSDSGSDTDGEAEDDSDDDAPTDDTLATYLDSKSIRAHYGGIWVGKKMRGMKVWVYNGGQVGFSPEMQLSEMTRAMLFNWIREVIECPSDENVTVCWLVKGMKITLETNDAVIEFFANSAPHEDWLVHIYVDFVQDLTETVLPRIQPTNQDGGGGGSVCDCGVVSVCECGVCECVLGGECVCVTVVLCAGWCCRVFGVLVEGAGCCSLLLCKRLWGSSSIFFAIGATITGVFAHRCKVLGGGAVGCYVFILLCYLVAVAKALGVMSFLWRSSLQFGIPCFAY
ncbi:hypothetical protein IFM89_017456, partial [Coptis chinensis]